jgi:ribosomal protein L5
LGDIIAKGDFDYGRVYRRRVIPQLVEEFGYEDAEVPKISKISINCGVAKVSKKSKRIRSSERETHCSYWTTTTYDKS